MIYEFYKVNKKVYNRFILSFSVLMAAILLAQINFLDILEIDSFYASFEDMLAPYLFLGILFLIIMAFALTTKLRNLKMKRLIVSMRSKQYFFKYLLLNTLVISLLVTLVIIVFWLALAEVDIYTIKDMISSIVIILQFFLIGNFLHFYLDDISKNTAEIYMKRSKKLAIKVIRIVRLVLIIVLFVILIFSVENFAIGYDNLASALFSVTYLLNYHFALFQFAFLVFLINDYRLFLINRVIL